MYVFEGCPRDIQDARAFTIACACCAAGAKPNSFVSAAEHLAYPFKQCTDVVPGLLALNVQHLGPLPSLAFDAPSGMTMLIGRQAAVRAAYI